MNLDKRIYSLVQWGNALQKVIQSLKGEVVELNTQEEKLVAAAQISKSYNAWFTMPSVILAMEGVHSFLQKENLEKFVKNYQSSIEAIKEPKRILIIMAGNIPMVGFHDLLCTLLSGHIAMVKSSSDDSHLLPALCDILKSIEPEFEQKVLFIERTQKNFDAVIATGTDNSAKYFDYYFGKYPHIIRKNRISVAVLNGKESDEELKEFSKDVFQYYGLGCRNVAKLYVPAGYQFKQIIEAFQVQLPYLENNKYQNNLEYQKAVMLLNKDPFIDAGFFFMKENPSPFSSVSVLHYQQYQNIEEVQESIEKYKEKVQCVVGNIEGGLPFGSAQCPGLNDFADGVDTMKFLVSL